MRALITQREEATPWGSLRESLEQEYTVFFERLGLALTPVSCFTSRLEEIVLQEPWDAVIFTGGGRLPDGAYHVPPEGPEQRERDALEKQLYQLAREKEIPVIGICRGMQQINALCGGKLTYLQQVQSPRIIGELHPVVLSEKQGQILVNHYHVHGICQQDLGEGLIPLAVDRGNGLVEAFTLPGKLLGVQWHPERMDPTNPAAEIFSQWLRRLMDQEKAGSAV